MARASDRVVATKPWTDHFRRGTEMQHNPCGNFVNILGSQIMHHHRIALLAILTVTIGIRPASASGKLTRDEAAKLAAEGFIYGYPLVLMDISRQVMTAAPRPEVGRAPANQFNDSQEFPDPSFTDVVSPNADTLYSMAWLDLSKEPIVLDLPDVGTRYYLVQMMDAWSNVFASPGTRTTGNRKGSYAIVGPAWTGTLPSGLKAIKSPTDMVWIIGRTQTNGKADYPAVRAMKNQYLLIPLSAWGKDYAPPAEVPVNPNVDARTAPVAQVDKLDAITFFGRLAALMKDNPPAAADKPMVDKLARLGIEPGKAFPPDGFDPEISQGLSEGVKAASASLAAEGKSLSGVPRVNGWSISRDMGRYGANYRHRAVIAMVGLGANLPEDAIYPMTVVDGDGKRLNGSNKYIIKFAKGQLPPAQAFWSLTMYNARRFFVANPINRYAIGDRDRLKLDADESLTLYLQHASPGNENESNWLPAPEGDFNLILRIYWPRPDALSGAWTPPPVTKAVE
jgi:hypothetical protein